MNDKLIRFDNIDWESPQEGVRQKVYVGNGKKLRLLVFRESFIEKEWCLKGHVGYVIEGEMKINFDGNIQSYRKGDGIWIDEGERSKHKVIIEKGKQIMLILFESI